MKSVAIFGKFCSGKTTLANVLVDEYGFTKVSMAENMKNIVKEVYGHTDKSHLVWVTRRDGTKEQITVREVLQRLGDAVKDADRDLWLKWLEQDMAFMRGPFVMDDARLIFEAEELKKSGWVLVKLSCPEKVRLERYMNVYGKPPTDAEMYHSTELDVDCIDHDIELDATLTPEYLAAVVASLASEDGDEM